ncbi:hypothetical protein [Neptunomonas japonica]|uniref:Guanylate cyclase domain-containing protein n=1 Tax=Neptunomonas japonica JAMM 1380 TaxID=1441457 RepID=A0A7R6PGE8_9GAMM|nr:hypothetical protein [Neptunomonas japonica]BBB29138.1 hypothetical protein NEJAP_1185 [Neptunomonas japonica JAMM 1380]
MNRAVAFIDVLGFKQKIVSESATDLGEKYKRVIRNALEKHSINADFSKEPAIFPEMSGDDEFCISNVFSDSIILSSFDDSETNCLKLLVFTYRLARSMIVQGFLVRGGISYGDMFVDLEDDIFVGTALTEAYELEMNQEWAGITIHDNLVNAFPHIFDGTREYAGYLNCLFVKYPVPMKRGEVKELYTINWRWNLIIQKGTKSLLGEPTDWAAKVKIDNTLKYAKFIRSNPLAYPADSFDCPIEIRTMYAAEGPPGDKMPSHGDEY